MRKSFVGWNKADGISCLGCTSRIVCDGITTRYEYDAAGRMIKEGDKTYTYGYLDKVMSVRDGANTYTYTYHPDGQLATADYGNSGRARTLAAPQGEESPTFETFIWDGLALIQRGNEHFINEPHVGGGNPIASSKGASFFNDMLGTTVGAKSGKTYFAAALTAFGARELEKEVGVGERRENLFFTGKPEVAGLGHAFLMRNYRAGLAKWQTVDPIGYPDGWNQLAYCRNGVTDAVDLWGCVTDVSNWLDLFVSYAQNAAKIGGRDKIEELTSQSVDLVGKQETWRLEQCDVEVKDCPDAWVRTGNTEVINGVTWYQEECTDKIYTYVAAVLLMKIESPSILTIKVTGSATTVLGLLISKIPHAKPASLLLAGLGTSAETITYSVDFSDNVPYGLVFTRKLLDDKKTVMPPRSVVHYRWVE